jgi:hypothetical protein
MESRGPPSIATTRLLSSPLRQRSSWRMERQPNRAK